MERSFPNWLRDIMTSDAFSNYKASIKNLLFLVLGSLLLSGCAQLVRTEQPVSTDWGTLSAGQTTGQTFVAKYDGLAGIYFYLSPQNTGNGEIRLHLRSSPQVAGDLAVSLNTLTVDAVKAPGYYGFFVPAQASSNQKYYYAFLEVTGSGDVQVGKATGDAYLNGALYQNGTAEDAQTAFQLSYSRRKSILGLGWEAVSWVGILAIGFFLFILPGWGLFSLLWSGWGGRTWPEKLGLSAGLSLALYPLLMLWTDIIGLHLGVLYAWLPPILGFGMILWRNRKRLNVHAFSHFTVRPFPLANVLLLPWVDIVFIGIVVLIILTRFWAIRSLDVPMWGDSYQHTMMAQLLVDHGGLFNSWQPYAELQTLTYHFGFHTAVAVFHWVSRLDVPKAVLWTGQILNVLAVIALYPLATRVGGNRWAGVGAVLVAGLLSPMPMYYINWGRYTQLAGQVILPGTIFLAWATLETKARDWRLIGLACIALSGLALTHYLLSIFAGLFFVAFFLLHAQREKVRTLFINTALLLAGVVVLFLPWFVHVFFGKLPNILAYYVTAPTKAASNFLQEFNAIGDISFYLPMMLWLLMLLCVAWGFWRHEKNLVLVALWWFLNLLATNPQWLHLPGEGVITNFTLFIASYVPAGLLIGAGFGWLHLSLREPFFSRRYPQHKWVYSFLLLLLVTGIGLWGARQRLGDLNVISGALVTRPDQRAAEWIQENTPQSARFLVNSFFAYGNTLIVGSDGGWWLPLLAERQTTLPPLTYGSERGPRTDYILWIDKLTGEIQNKGITHPDVLALLRERSVKYVYIGQRQGRVNYDGPYVLNPDELLSSSYFRVIYHQDRVWIFEVVW
jgi:hypothetical protein